MKTMRRTEIRVETRELKIIHFRSGRVKTYFCAECRANAPHLFPAEAASLLSVSENDVRRLVLNKKIHAAAGGDGRPLLCGYSLAALVKG
jgi:hypothetical protein